MPRSHFFAAALIAAFAFAARAEPPAAGGNPADDAVWLRVKGKEIVTSQAGAGGGKPFIPVGVGYCRDVIIRAQDDEVMKFCKERYLNTVRLSFYLLYFNGKKERPIDVDAHIRDFIDPVVEAARRNHVYVILDDHEYLSAEIDEATAREKQKSNLWDEATIQKWIDGWVKVATRYRDEPYVLGYELINEPHDIPADVAREKITRCLQAIRKVDTRHIILLGNNSWSHSRGMEKTWGATASTVDAPYNNVVFTFHDYPLDDHPWKVQKNITSFRDAHGVPVLCTEFGATHWNKSETVCREFEAGMFAVFARENVGWMIWALKTLQDQPRNTTNTVDNVGLGPPRVYDSCQYSDIWKPVARIMGSPFPAGDGANAGEQTR